MTKSTSNDKQICYLCGTDKIFEVFEVGSCSIVRCRKCGLAYTEYLNSSSQESYQGEEYFTKRNKYLSRIGELEEHFGKLLDKIERHKSHGRLLDLGCGPGILLDVARERGWQVAGLDISEWAIQHARNELHLDVVQGNVQDRLLPLNHFDVVIINHTLEHMSDPAETLLVAHSILRAGGIIAVGVPNFGSPVAKVRGPKWRSLLPEQHRWHFTLPTLKTMLTSTGYRVVDVTYENHDYGRTITEQAVWQIPSWLLRISGRGEAMLVIAEKE